MRFCKSCGESVSETAKFCEHCGIKLNETEEGGASVKSPKKLNENEKAEVDELDLTALDKKVAEGQIHGEQTNENGKKDEKPTGVKTKQSNNIINLNEVLESEEKVEMDNSIKREVLADDEVFSKICPMCGEEMQLNKQLLENTPVVVKCLKCGNETKIW